LGASFSDPLHILVGEYPGLTWVETLISFASGLLIFMFLYLFPDGRFVPAWARWLVVGALTLGLARLAGLQLPGATFLVLGVFLVLTGGYAQWYRYRNVSNSAQRQQTKWVSFGFALALVVLVITWTILGVAPELYEPGTPTFFVIDTLLYSGMTLMPLSIGLAILRYHLYDVDFLINRTLVYGVLTATLALIYLCSVVLLQSLFRTVAGQTSQLAIVASTLGIAALFTPLRRRLQQTIDRLFYRRKYDAVRVLAAFNHQLRDETDIDRLTHGLLSVVRSTFQPEHIAMWPCRPSRTKPVAEEGVRREA
ncbi:MAG TPA: hypothetical protein VFX76_12515, partial [Roseiflexaceae bacterium]|nr:hypothetical protein [Roseiflexaceae bacterium]